MEFAPLRACRGRRAGVPIESERIAGWIGVLDGLVRVTCTDESGRSTTITGVPVGGWFGEGTVLRREPCRYHVEAVRESCLAILPAETFDALLASPIGFNRFVMDQLKERLSHFIGAREWERLRRPGLRVAYQLAQLHNPVLHSRAGASQSEAAGVG